MANGSSPEEIRLLTARSERATDILKEEWRHCEAGIARFDTLVFQIRTWAVTIAAAMVAASFTGQHPSIMLVGVVSTLVFLFMEAQNKVFQRVVVRRAHAVQMALRQYVDRGYISAMSLDSPTLAASFHSEFQGGTVAHLNAVWRCAKIANVLPFYVALSSISLICFVVTVIVGQ